MKAQHTPGPWELMGDPCHYDTLTSIRGGPAEIRGKGIEWRQMMVEVGGYADPSTSEANARLIAAAPELLALLIELTDIEGPLPGTATWASKVKAAIAKATGEESP